MSLLSMCRDACALAPVAQPSFIINNPDQTAVLCLALANRAGNEVSRKPPGGWVSLIREYDFTTKAIAAQPGTISNVGNSAVITGLTGIQAVQPGIWIASGTGVPLNAVVRAVTPAVSGVITPTTVTLNVPATQTGAGSFSFGQSDYPLPSDFERPVDATFWDRTRYWQMRGPMSPQQWQVYRSSVIGKATVQRRFRFRSIYNPGGQGIGTSGVAAGSVGTLSAFRTYLSIDPVPFDNGSSLVFEYVSNGWCQSTLSPTAGVPQSSWQNDNDVAADANLEYLIGLNVTWRLLRRLGLSYNEELNEYETEVDKAMASDGGSRILNMTPYYDSYLLSAGNVQEGFFPGV